MEKPNEETQQGTRRAVVPNILVHLQRTCSLGRISYTEISKTDLASTFININQPGQYRFFPALRLAHTLQS